MSPASLALCSPKVLLCSSLKEEGHRLANNGGPLGALGVCGVRHTSRPRLPQTCLAPMLGPLELTRSLQRGGVEWGAISGDPASFQAEILKPEAGLAGVKGEAPGVSGVVPEALIWGWDSRLSSGDLAEVRTSTGPHLAPLERRAHSIALSAGDRLALGRKQREIRFVTEQPPAWSPGTASPPQRSFVSGDLTVAAEV